MSPLEFVFVCAIAITNVDAGTDSASEHLPLENLYRHAQREYHRKNYEAALQLLKDYVDKTATLPYERPRLFWAVEQMGRIYLREQHDPNAAIAFFSTLVDDKRLSEAEQDVVASWIAGAQEWEKLGKIKGFPLSANKLYQTGTDFYRQGMKQKKYPADEAGNAQLHIAATYLVPFIVQYDDDARIAEALLMMGDIRRHSWTDFEYWSDNFYLREVIRRFPHSSVAMRAYSMLEEEVHLGYSGASGDHTPPSMLEMLQQLKRLATPMALQPSPATNTEKAKAKSVP